MIGLEDVGPAPCPGLDGGEAACTVRLRGGVHAFNHGHTIERLLRRLRWTVQRRCQHCHTSRQLPRTANTANTRGQPQSRPRRRGPQDFEGCSPGEVRGYQASPRRSPSTSSEAMLDRTRSVLVKSVLLVAGRSTRRLSSASPGVVGLSRAIGPPFSVTVQVSLGQNHSF